MKEIAFGLHIKKWLTFDKQNQQEASVGKYKMC